MNNNRGFTLLELMISISIIGVLLAISVAFIGPIRDKGKDAKRKADLSQIGRLIVGSECYRPADGPGDYDISDIFAEYVAAHPESENAGIIVPRDPNGGTDAESFYRYVYVVSGNQHSCAVYANLDSEGEEVTLTGIDQPTPGRGTGVLQGAVSGHNGTDRFFQVSN